jgi:hypothetical protein
MPPASAIARHPPSLLFEPIVDATHERGVSLVGATVGTPWYDMIDLAPRRSYLTSWPLTLAVPKECRVASGPSEETLSKP